MITLTFYGGVKEIGGNKILLQDGDTKIFLDFGMSFGKRAEFFEEFLTPRTANGIGDFLAMGLIPDIKGIYRKDLLKHEGRKPEEPEVNAVFLSHGHADHTNYISFLHRNIPIYCGKTTLKLLRAIEEQSKRSIENEVINFKKRPLFRADYRKPAIERIFKTFKTGDKIKIGSLEIEPVHVDHSVPGAYGFIIHTSSGPVVYTGDLRLHGTNPQLTRDFVERAKKSEPVAMICEGTRIKERDNNKTEKDVYEKAKKIIPEKGLSIVDFNFKDVDRFRTFFKIAKELDKKMVLSFKHACYLDRYSKDKKLGVPDCCDENLLLLKPKIATGTYDDGDYTDKYIKCRLHNPNVVTVDELDRNCMIVLNFWYFNMLVDIKPAKGSLYMHSLSEPFNEEMEISFNRMKNWMDYFGLKFVQNHCSGHASGSDIREMVNEIKPKKVFPVHTEFPGVFRRFGIKSKMVKEGKKYKI